MNRIIYLSSTWTEAILFSSELFQNGKLNGGTLMNYEDEYLRGCDFLNRGKLKEAINIFEEILRKDKLHHESINKIGVAYARQNMLDDALEMFNKCIELKPDFVPAVVNIGNVYKQKSDNDRAMAFYNMAIEIDESYYLAYYNLAAAYKSIGNYDEYFKNLKRYKRSYKQHINSNEKHRAGGVNKKHIYITAIGIVLVVMFLIFSSRGI